MGDKTTLLRTVDAEAIMELLKQAGLRPDEELLITVEPGSVQLRRDPVAVLWGSLGHSSKNPRDLINEAMMQESRLFHDDDDSQA